MDDRLTLPKNTLLGESYRIEQVIGAGGFGITYAAEDINLGTKVAIKEYYPEEFGARDATLQVGPKSQWQKRAFDWGLQSFLQEARTLARFRHPSVVQVTRVFEAHSTAYMVMGFEEGLNFETWLKRLGRSPTQGELDRIVAPLLDALEIMHAQKFLHRDIAPDNIIVRADGTPVLLDFGAARQAVVEASRTLTGIIKPGYSPHEQYSADSRLQGPWTDLYALGGTIYRAVTGQPPEEATLRIDDDRMMPAVQAAVGEYRASFLVAVDACLRVRATERPQSVAELRSTLLGKVHPPIGAAFIIRQMALRWPALVAIGVLALAVGAYWMADYARWSPRERPDPDTVAKSGREIAPQEKVQPAEPKKEKVAIVAPLPESVPSSPRATATGPIVGEAPCDGVEAIIAKQKRCLKGGAGKMDWFKDCPTCPEMVAVPAGSSSVGSPTEELGRFDSEDQVTVSIPKPFAVGRFAVTRGEFAAFVSATGHKTDGGCQALSDNEWKLDADRSWRSPGFPQDDRHPVICVNWNDAKAYVGWLSSKTRKTYRLLSEVEREYVARAGTTTAFWWGPSISISQANYDGNFSYADGSNGEWRKTTVLVDSFVANPLGLYNVHGNVWEWTEDCWNEKNGGRPDDASARTSGDCGSRVVRGGSWSNGPSVLRSAFRIAANSTNRANNIGFRVSRSP